MPCVRVRTISPRTCRRASILTRRIWRSVRTTASFGSMIRQTLRTIAKMRWTWALTSPDSPHPSRSGFMVGTPNPARDTSPSTTSLSPAAPCPCPNRELSRCWRSERCCSDLDATGGSGAAGPEITEALHLFEDFNPEDAQASLQNLCRQVTENQTAVAGRAFALEHRTVLVKPRE